MTQPDFDVDIDFEVELLCLTTFCDEVDEEDTQLTDLLPRGSCAKGRVT